MKRGDRVKWIKTIILVSLLFTIFNVINPATVHACNCYIPDNAIESLGISDAVFTGKVKQISKKTMNGNTYNAVLMEVGQIWKGIQESEVIVYTTWSSCQFTFVVEEEYLLYAYEINGKLHVTNCGRSTTLTHATIDIQQLGEGQEPSIKVNLSTSLNWYIVLIVTLVVIFALMMFFKARKNR